jgi:hypothetical protein
MLSFANVVRPRFSVAAVACAVALFSACSGNDDMSDPPVPALDPPPPGQGVQLLMASPIAAGQEIERCKFVQAPPEGLNINHQKIIYTPGSHHVLLFLTPYTSIPTMDIHGQTHDTSGVMDCLLGAGTDWKLSNLLGGAQSFDGGSMIDLPPGVAVKVPGNAVMLIEAHYLNAAPKDLNAEARINLYTIPDGDVKQEGGVLFLYDPIIRVPAQGQSTARMRCRAAKDITLTNIQSHMHRRAVNFVAKFLDSMQNPVETLYENTDWENVPVKPFSPGKAIPAGSYFDFHCDYNNTEMRTVLQGPSTRDEMCLLLGSYYPRDRDTAMCTQATIVGSGTKSCFESFLCATDALKAQDNDAFYGCMIDSCEAAATPLNAVLQCLQTKNGGACDMACQDPTATGCTDCLKMGCQPATNACLASKCG